MGEKRGMGEMGMGVLGVAGFRVQNHMSISPVTVGEKGNGVNGNGRAGSCRVPGAKQYVHSRGPVTMARRGMGEMGMGVRELPGSVCKTICPLPGPGDSGREGEWGKWEWARCRVPGAKPPSAPLVLVTRRMYP